MATSMSAHESYCLLRKLADAIAKDFPDLTYLQCFDMAYKSYKVDSLEDIACELSAMSEKTAHGKDGLKAISEKLSDIFVQIQTNEISISEGQTQANCLVDLLLKMSSDEDVQ